MRVAIGLLAAVLCVPAAHGQGLRKKKTQDIFTTPRDVKSEQIRKRLGEEDWDKIQWDLRSETMASDQAIRENVVESETGPFYMAKSVRGDATMSQRSKNLGRGEPSYTQNRPWTYEDRKAASAQRERRYPGQAEQEAILEAVYLHFFGYRERGFAPDATAYFLAYGPHEEDAPRGVIERLSKLKSAEEYAIKVLPASRAMEVTDAQIRDRESGAYGAVFRVDEIGPIENDGATVVATFSERDGFWFTRELALQYGPDGWAVTGDRDYRLDR